MASDNKISREITPVQKTAIGAAVLSLKTVLQEITVSLSDAERHGLPRIADKTLAFDSKCDGYMASRPDLVPGFVDMDERAKDAAVIDVLLSPYRELLQIVQGVEDTLALANSDKYVGDLAFYQSVKQAAARGVSGAAAIYDDLKARFPGRPGAAANPPPAA